MSTPESKDGLLASLSNELANAVERASQSLVTVEARRRLSATGIVWPGENLVVTADHVVERDEDMAVTLPDGSRSSATLAGRDPGSDIAVLRVSGKSLAPAEPAPAGSVKIGHLVLALGRPGGGSAMASFGVVSALGGTWRTRRGGTVDGYIRADVVLYPGFSGGPLVDAQGRVAGLNSSHLAGGEALAIPASTLSGIVQTLATQGRIRRAYLGIGSQPVVLPAGLRQKLGLTQETGLMVLRVEPGSPADGGGVLMGDILLALSGQTVSDPEELQAALGPAVVGTPLQVRVVRGGESKDLTLTPGERV